MLSHEKGENCYLFSTILVIDTVNLSKKNSWLRSLWYTHMNLDMGPNKFQTKKLTHYIKSKYETMEI